MGPDRRDRTRGAVHAFRRARRCARPPCRNRVAAHRRRARRSARPPGGDADTRCPARVGAASALGAAVAAGRRAPGPGRPLARRPGPPGRRRGCRRPHRSPGTGRSRGPCPPRPGTPPCVGAVARGARRAAAGRACARRGRRAARASAARGRSGRRALDGRRARTSCFGRACGSSRSRARADRESEGGRPRLGARARRPRSARARERARAAGGRTARVEGHGSDP